MLSFPDMPVVTLKMGSSLNPDDIKEGDDVYFECNIRSNPKAYKLAWFHNVSIYFIYTKINKIYTLKEFLIFMIEISRMFMN